MKYMPTRSCYTLLLSSVFLLAGCSSNDIGGASDQPEVSGHVERVDSISVQGNRFELVGCQLSAISSGDVISESPTGLDGDCFFVREHSGEPQTYSTGSGLTALVMTSKPHKLANACDTKIRAFRLDPENLHVSEKEQRIQSCSRGPKDELLIATLSNTIPTN